MRKDVLNHLKTIKDDLELLNRTELARRLNCDPRTIDRYISENLSSKRKSRVIKSKIDDFKDIIIEKVDNYGSSSMAIFKFIKKNGYDGGYHTVNNFINDYKNDEIEKITEKFSRSSSNMAYVQWKEKIVLKNKNNKEFNFNMFFIILGYSRMKYVILTSNKRQSTMFSCLSESFEYFKTVPKEIIFDKTPSIIDRNMSTLNNIVINKNLKKFSEKNGFEVAASLTYKPVIKEKEETLNKLKKYLSDYVFEDMDRLNEFMRIFNNKNNKEIEKIKNKFKNKKF